LTVPDDQETYLIDRDGGCVALHSPEAIETYKSMGFWVVSRKKYEKTRAAQYPPKEEGQHGSTGRKQSGNGNDQQQHGKSVVISG
jgi:hypothetical protein